MRKYRKLPITAKQTPDISLTPVGKDQFFVHRESDDMKLGTFSKESLTARVGFTENQLKGMKGTTNFIRIKEGEK